jgi:DNA polymerase I-like protein with 3'-5' exonuclease and polymerase domains
MIINADAKQLEWFGAVYLSKDQVGYKEIKDGVDQHQDNQQAFKLKDRLTAKTFQFRILYGGSAYAFANDSVFIPTSSSEKFWEEAIQAFYKKYSGIAKWHEGLVRQAIEAGYVEIPTGRRFEFRKEFGKWPRTKILNYPVQGFGADFMTLARVIANRKIGRDADFICTVHDSLVFDAPANRVEGVVNKLFETWKELPSHFEELFKLPMDLPPKVEIGVGPNWKELTTVKERT